MSGSILVVGKFLFVFFLRSGRLLLQEINHAGAGGLWAELVSNRGHFENFMVSILF